MCAFETKLHQYRLRKQAIFINSPIEPRKRTLYALLEQLISVMLGDGKHIHLDMQKRITHIMSIPTHAVYRLMVHRDQTGAHAVILVYPSKSASKTACGCGLQFGEM